MGPNSRWHKQATYLEARCATCHVAATSVTKRNRQCIAYNGWFVLQNAPMTIMIIMQVLHFATHINTSLRPPTRDTQPPLCCRLLILVRSSYISSLRYIPPYKHPATICIWSSYISSLRYTPPYKHSATICICLGTRQVPA